MSSDEMFDAVMDEAEMVSNGSVKYSESWISKLDGNYEQRTHSETSAYTERA